MAARNHRLQEQFDFFACAAERGLALFEGGGRGRDRAGLKAVPYSEL
jgi:hypothetical protein